MKDECAKGRDAGMPRTRRVALRDCVEHMLDGFGIYAAVRDSDGTITDFRIKYVNEAACKLNRLPKRRQQGRLLCEMLPAHRESGLFDEYCEVVETGVPLEKPAHTYEDTFGQDERLRRTYSLRAWRYQDGLAVTWRDVTEQIRTRLAAEESAAKIADLISVAVDGMAVVDGDGRVVFANAAADSLLLGVQTETAEGLLLGIPTTGAEGTDILVRRADHQLATIEMRAVATTWNGSAAFVVSLRDVTKARRALEAAQRGAAIVKSSDDAIIGKALDGTIESWNRGAEALYGYTAEEAIGRNVAMLVPDDVPNDIPEILAKIRRGETVDHYETTRRTKDGKRLTVSLTVSPIRDENGTVISASAIGRDVTEQIEARERIEHLNRVLRAIRNVNQLIVQEKDAARLVEKACKLLIETRGYRGACVTLYGTDNAQKFAAAAGWNAEFDVFREKLSRGWLPPCATVAAAAPEPVFCGRAEDCRDCPLRGGEETGCAAVVALRHQDDRFGCLCVALPAGVVWYDEEEKLLNEVAGDLAFALHSIEVGRAHEEADARLTAAVKAGGVGLWDYYPQGNRAIFSDEWKQQLGYEPHEIGDSADECSGRLHPEDRERVLDFLTGYIEGGGKGDYRTEFRLRHKDDSYRWVLSQGAAIEHENGVVTRMLGSHVDITEPKRMEEALRISEARYKRLAENSPAVVFQFRMTPDGALSFPFITESVRNVVGVFAEDVVRDADNLLNLLEPSQRQDFQETVFESARNLSPYDHELRLSMNGRSAWLRACATPERQADGSVIWDGFFQDISERKRSEAKLLKREFILTQAEALTKTGSWEWDVKTFTVFFSDEWRRIHGVQDASLPPDELAKIAHPDDRERIRKAWEATASEGAPYEIEHRILRQDTGEERIVKASGVVVRDQSGKPMKVYVVAQDVTELRAREARQAAMEAQLRQTQKMESIGTLAGGVAHEINNPVMGIMNYAQLIIDKLGPDSDVAEFATEIGRETERVAGIVRNLLGFARQEKHEHSAARMSDIVEATLSLVRTVLRHDQVALDVDVPKDLPRIQCRSQQIPFCKGRYRAASPPWACTQEPVLRRVPR